MLAALGGEIAARLGRWQEARSYAQSALRLLESSEFCAVVDVQRVCGTIEAHDDPTMGRTRLEWALEAARRSGMRLEEARCLLALGQIDSSKRDRYFATARAIFEDCGSKYGLIELERAEAAASFSSV